MTAPPAPPAAPPRRKLVRNVLLLLVLTAAIALGWNRWSTHWRPDSAVWTTQGVAIGPDNTPVSWPSLVTQNVRFAYIDATQGTRVLNPRFSQDHDLAMATGIRAGAVHHYALCAQVGDQAAAFVRLVPREDDALPTLVLLEIDEECTRQPTRALLLTELSTFLTQLETHMGKPAVIAPSQSFEARYAIFGAINRPLLVRSIRAEPDHDGPAWALWLANDRLRVSGSTGPTRWLVLNDGSSDAHQEELP